MCPYCGTCPNCGHHQGHFGHYYGPPPWARRGSWAEEPPAPSRGERKDSLEDLKRRLEEDLERVNEELSRA